MRRKGILSLFITVFSVVAFAGMAFAAQNINLKTTVPDVPKSACYRDGTQTMEIDNGTVLSNGDVMRFSLSNNTTLCKSFDYFLTLHDGVGSNSAWLPTSTAADPVTATTVAGAKLDCNIGGVVSTEYGFLVKGSSGNQFYTMTVARRNTVTGVVLSDNVLPFTLTYTAALAGDKFIIKFFDDKFLAPYFWKLNAPPAGTSATYLNSSAVPATGTSFAGADNTLCTNTSSALFVNEYQESTANSIPATVAANGILGSPVVFSGDYRIAHVVAEQTWSLYACSKSVVPNIILGTGAQATTCVAFDYDTWAGYCSVPVTVPPARTPKVILQSSYPLTPADQYVVTMEILVNGAGGEKGVYFGGAPSFAPYKTSTDACAASAGLVTPGVTYYKADGVTTGIPNGVQPSDCGSITSARKLVKLVTTAHTFGVAADQYFIEANMAPFVYQLSEVAAGAAVSVKITLSTVNCGVAKTFTVPIGTFGCGPTAGAGALSFPYFTSLTADDFWNGIAIINKGTTAGIATLTAYEADGSVGTFVTPSIPAKSMYVNLLESMTWAGTGLGGSRCFIQVTSDIAQANLDGFGMIANEVTGESMGYLPRP